MPKIIELKDNVGLMTSGKTTKTNILVFFDKSEK